MQPVHRLLSLKDLPTHNNNAQISKWTPSANGVCANRIHISHLIWSSYFRLSSNPVNLTPLFLHSWSWLISFALICFLTDNIRSQYLAQIDCPAYHIAWNQLKRMKTVRIGWSTSNEMIKWGKNELALWLFSGMRCKVKHLQKSKKNYGVTICILCQHKGFSQVFQSLGAWAGQ